ncbi:MAG TPA: hypothetical protein EYN38_08630 [Flavobacteriales bacterium]|nr:hypothetical protein [Flavobacteriales bacterium]
MGFKAWRAQRSAALDNAEYLEPGKWADFKVFYNEAHFDGTLTELLPMGMSTGFTLTPLDTTGSEWLRSSLQYNDAAAATVSPLLVGMLADDNVAGGYGSLMHAYGVLRSPTLAPDPLVPVFASGSWITKTGEESSDMSAAVIDIIEDDNDDPPYANQTDTLLPPTYVGGDQSSPGGMMMDTSVTGSTGRSVSLSGGLVPCGLLVVTLGATQSGVLRVHVTRGNYKGVAALPMGDFR